MKEKNKGIGYGPSRRARFAVVLHYRDTALFGGMKNDNSTDDDMMLKTNEMGRNVAERTVRHLVERKGKIVKQS